MRQQFDLFVPSNKTEDEKKPVAPRSRKSSGQTIKLTEEDMLKHLKETGRYRILQKLEPSPIDPDICTLTYPRLGVVIDTETTGLSAAQDEIIEIGAVLFRYADNGTIGGVCGTFGALQQPSKPIPATITRITGITDEMVKGQEIPRDQLEAIIDEADLIIAHNAAFDRPFLERFSSVFSSKPWACSVKEVDWADRGFEGAKLGYLIGQSGYFHNGHRAEDDCHALLAVLREVSDRETPFAELLQTSQRVRIKIFAENSPFEMKDTLKARGYRWSDGNNNRPKSWWTEVGEDELEEELQFLRTEIYNWRDAEPLLHRVSAMDRYK